MRKICFVILFVMVLTALPSCSVHIKDSNGDDVALAVLTDEDICSDKKTHSLFMSSFMNTSGRTTKVIGKNRDIDCEKVSFSAKKFSGVYDIQASYFAKSDCFTIYWNVEVKNGNFAMFLISPGGEIIHKFDLNAESQSFFAEAEGEYIVRIAGESAEVSVKLHRDFITMREDI
ncbi:MAG: hypothetical protein E7491_07675 [Ruminococcaceae bacterium]|nr:hypothetical protein [Oscillospiraceae bacterium]